MSQFPNRAALWLNKLAPDVPLMSDLHPLVQTADGQTAGESVRFIAVVPGANNHYPRAADGEVGLLESWTPVKVINETIAADADRPVKRLIVAVIDVLSQAYGHREEASDTHRTLAGAAGAYAKAHFAGCPVIGLIVGKATSGALLVHGYQANRLIAFNDSGVLAHAMDKELVVRITLRIVEALEKLAATIPPMAYDASNYATPGLLPAFLDIDNPDTPNEGDPSLVSRILRDAIADARKDTSLKYRLGAENRRSSQLVRDRMRASW